MTYEEFRVDLLNYCGVDEATDADFSRAIPRIIEMAEHRCYRDLDPIDSRKIASTTLIPGVPFLEGPHDWLIGRAMFVTPAAGGLRSPVLRRDDTFLAEYWPDQTLTGVPKYFAESGFQEIMIAPTPDDAYGAILHYTYRPETLSALNPETWLSVWVPDVFFKAAMIEAFNFMKGDWQAMTVTWGNDYQAALKTAQREEARRKAEGYFDRPPTPAPSSTASLP